MFDLAPVVIGIKPRTGPSQWFAEAVATFALVLTILGGVRHAKAAIPWLVGLVITAAYWFTASTSFANPAVTPRPRFHQPPLPASPWATCRASWWRSSSARRSAHLPPPFLFPCRHRHRRVRAAQPAE